MARMEQGIGKGRTIQRKEMMKRRDDGKLVMRSLIIRRKEAVNVKSRLVLEREERSLR